MKRNLMLPLLMTVLFGCAKLTFDGGTFLTVKGKIIDSTGRALPNFGLSIFNVGPYNGLWATSGSATSAEASTDINGNYQITFPSSNGSYYVQLQTGYVIYDTLPIYTPYPNYTNRILIDTASFQNYLSIMQPIKVKPQ